MLLVQSDNWSEIFRKWYYLFKFKILNICLFFLFVFKKFLPSLFIFIDIFIYLIYIISFNFILYCYLSLFDKNICSILN